MNLRHGMPWVMMFAQGGCMTGPRGVDYTPQQYLSANQPSRVWLTLNDGRQVVVREPRVITDTLFGWSENGTEDLTIAISDVQEVRARRVSTFRTALIPATFVAAGVTLFIVVKGVKGEGGTPPSIQCEIDEDC